MEIIFLITISGPDLPHSCIYGSMVPMPNSKGALLLGCATPWSYTNKIYQLAWNGNDLIWNTLSNELKNPRGVTVAMWIPHNLTTCTLSGG